MAVPATHDIGFAYPRKSPLLVRQHYREADRHPLHSLRYGRLSRLSIIISIAIPRYSTPSTAAVIGMSIPRRAARRATAAAVTNTLDDRAPPSQRFCKTGAAPHC